MYIPNPLTNQAEYGTPQISTYGQALTKLTGGKPNYKGKMTNPYMDDTGSMYFGGAVPIYKIYTPAYHGILPMKLFTPVDKPYPYELG